MKQPTPVTVTYDPAAPNSMQWTKKYAPQRAEDVVGNEATVLALQDWLREWQSRRRRANRREKGGASSRKNRSFIVSDGEESSSDDYYCASDDTYDGEDDGAAESDSLPPNTALLRGPPGVGKTCAVYALARQLGFKVLEVNASSLRGGKQVMAQLQEATQSHHVKKKTLAAGEGLKGMLSKKADATTSTPNRSGDESINALILFEDIDVVFKDVDEGFYAAVNSLVSTTKRPVILTTSDPHFSARRFLKSDPRPFVFSPLSAPVAARYLQLLCLCEGFPLDAAPLARLAEFNVGAGALGRSILDLQYWTTSSTAEKKTDALEQGVRPPPPGAKALSCAEGEEEQTVVATAAGDVGLGGPSGAGSEERATSIRGREVEAGDDDGDDLIAKLMSINKEDAVWRRGPHNPLPGAYGAALANTFSAEAEEGKAAAGGSRIDARRLFEDLCRVQRLWTNGLAEFYDANKDVILPLPREEEDDARQFPMDKTEQAGGEAAYKRIKRPFDESFRTSESSSFDSESEQTAADKKGSSADEKSGADAAADTKAAAFLRRRRVMERLSEVADVSADFVPAEDPAPWWVADSQLSTWRFGAVDDDAGRALAIEIGAAVQCLSVRRAAADIEQVLSEGSDGPDMKLAVPAGSFTVGKERGPNAAAEIDRRVLNRAVADLTVNATPLVLDTMPVLRSMARSEEARRTGPGADSKKRASRSGRFVHYFEVVGLDLDEDTLAKMCSTSLV